jgi:hypothetical protein
MFTSKHMLTGVLFASAAAFVQEAYNRAASVARHGANKASKHAKRMARDAQVRMCNNPH